MPLVTTHRPHLCGLPRWSLAPRAMLAAMDLCSYFESSAAILSSPFPFLSRVFIQLTLQRASPPTV